MKTLTDTREAVQAHEDDESQDASEQLAAHQQLRVRDRIRHECMQLLSTGATDRQNVMTDENVREYMRMGLQEEGLTFLKTEEEKTDALREHQREWIPNMIRDGRRLWNQAISMIAKAEGKKWISRDTAKELEAKLKTSNSFTDKKEFVEKELSDEVLKEARNIATRYDALMAKPASKMLKQSPVEHAKLLFSQDAFLNATPAVQKTLLAKAEAYLAAQETVDDAVLVSADKQLDRAFKNGSISQETKAHWLKLVEDKQNDKEMSVFVRTELPTFIAQWQMVRDTFDGAVTKAAHFKMPCLTPKAFLALKYPERKAYAADLEKKATLREQEEAEGQKEHPLISALGKAMKNEDWNVAKDIIIDAKKTDLSQKNKVDLLWMERYVEEHAETDEEKAEVEQASHETLKHDVQAMEESIQNAPTAVSKLYTMALESGEATLRAAMSGISNVKRAAAERQLDEETLHVSRVRSVAETRQRETAAKQQKQDAERETMIEDTVTEEPKELAPIKSLNTDVQTTAIPTPEKQKDPTEKTVYHFSAESCAAVLQDVQKRAADPQNDYQTLYAPEGLSLAQIGAISSDLHPIVKRGLAARKRLLQGHAQALSA